MNELQVSKLIAALTAQAQAINRLAESNETLAAMVYQTLANEFEDELPQAYYLSGKPKG